jgi:hypothetical protein
MESHQLYSAAAKIIGHRALARVLSVSLQHTYVLCADPITLDVPVRTDWDRTKNLLETVASHRDGRPVLIQWEMADKLFYDRVIRGERAEPLTCETVVTEAQAAISEFGELLMECKPGFVSDRIAKEAAEVIAKLERLVACAEAADDSGAAQPRKLRVQ